MKNLRQIGAWIAIVVILGLVITTFILGITGNPLSMNMLILTMGVSIVFWAMLWFAGVLVNRSAPEEMNPEEGTEEGKPEEETEKNSDASKE